VLVNGMDAFADPDTSVGLSCRLHRTPTGVDGAPTVEHLVDAIRRGAGATP
jgi:hypothetical protein